MTKSVRSPVKRGLDEFRLCKMSTLLRLPSAGATFIIIDDIRAPYRYDDVTIIDLRIRESLLTIGTKIISLSLSLSL